MTQTILYIDNDSLSVQLTKKMLKFTPYEILDAATGKSGVLLAQLHRPAMIMTEVNLADIDAPDLIATLRSYDILRHIPIVTFTTNMPYQLYQRCLDVGCAGQLAKPITKTNLLKAFQQFIPVSQAN